MTTKSAAHVEFAYPLRVVATARADGAASTDLDAKATRMLDELQQKLARRAVAEEELPPWTDLQDR